MPREDGRPNAMQRAHSGRRLPHQCPNGGVLSPMWEMLFPGEDAAFPDWETGFPSGEERFLKQKTRRPSWEMVFPSGEKLFPTQKTLSPSWEAVFPSGEELFPAQKTRHPSWRTVRPMFRSARPVLESGGPWSGPHPLFYAWLASASPHSPQVTSRRAMKTVRSEVGLAGSSWLCGKAFSALRDLPM